MREEERCTWVGKLGNLFLIFYGKVKFKTKISKMEKRKWGKWSWDHGGLGLVFGEEYEKNTILFSFVINLTQQESNLDIFVGNLDEVRRPRNFVKIN